MTSIAAHDHVGISVADLDRQRLFYGEALGLTEVVERLEITQARVRTAILRATSGLLVELVEREGSQPLEYQDAFDGARDQGFFHWALRVEDLDETFGRVVSAGASPVSEPAAGMSAGVRFAYVKDPEGNLLELVERATEPSGTPVDHVETDTEAR